MTNFKTHSKRSIFSPRIPAIFIILFLAFELFAQEKSAETCFTGDINTIILNLKIGVKGEVPAELFNLSKLEELTLSGDTEFQIPYDVRKLTSLKILDLSSTYIEELPSELSQLRSMQEIHLNYERWQYRLDEVKMITRAKIILE